MHRPERAMGFEPTTSCLEGKSSTTELHPLTSVSSQKVESREVKTVAAEVFDVTTFDFLTCDRERVGREGFEPPNPEGARFTVWCN